ncbi:MAG: copper chaperone PCu(A)C [Hyphomicrobiales bacterium]
MKNSFAAAFAAISRVCGALVALAMPALADAALAVSPAASGSAYQGMRVAVAAAPGEAAYTLGALRIQAPWMRATPKGATVAGGYLTITNTGSEPDRLMNVASDIAATVEVHEMSMSGGVMTMRPLDKPLEIKPGATLELKPGGYHVMFNQLKRGVTKGDKVKATLVFEKAGKIEIEFLAGGIAATGPGAAQMPGHKM